MSTPVLTRFRIAISRLFLAAALAFAFTTAGYADSSVKKNFNLPAGDAVSTLKVFTDQSGDQILYPAEQVRGVQTNPVHGELTNRDALDAMLANTDLVVVQDKETGALVVRKIAHQKKAAQPRQSKKRQSPRSNPNFSLTPNWLTTEKRSYFHPLKCRATPKAISPPARFPAPA